jgi:hypothetical protein
MSVKIPLHPTFFQNATQLFHRVEPVVSVSHEMQLLNFHELLTVCSHLGPFTTACLNTQDGQRGKIYEATLSCSQCDSRSFYLELTEGGVTYRLNVTRMCLHFPWV